jgi:hypothetical protein
MLTVPHRGVGGDVVLRGDQGRAVQSLAKSVSASNTWRFTVTLSKKLGKQVLRCG